MFPSSWSWRRVRIVSKGCMMNEMSSLMVTPRIDWRPVEKERKAETRNGDVEHVEHGHESEQRAIATRRCTLFAPAAAAQPQAGPVSSTPYR